MRLLKKLAVVCAAAAMVFGMCGVMPAHAKSTADEKLGELISYYRDYQETADTDIMRVLDELKEVDEKKYTVWSDIMAYWQYVNTDMEVSVGELPDGLPQDDSMCIVVLGFKLNDDGTMKQELIDRLTVGLQSAKKYPHAYIAVTGGGTAPGHPDATEGGLMARWLLDHGISRDRIIVEDKAGNTVGNAENTYNILHEKYPQVNCLAMVTSDYHVPRASVLFYSKCLLAAQAVGGEPLRIVANAGCMTGSQGYESISLQADGVASVAGVAIASKQKLSILNELSVAQKTMFVPGKQVDLKVTAGYDSKFTRDVTDLVTVEGFDPNGTEDQTITVRYEENGVSMAVDLPLSKESAYVFDRSYLQSEIDACKSMSQGEYTEGSLAVLADAIKKAEAVYKDAHASKEDVASAYTSLTEAKAKLIKLVNVAGKMPVEANHNNTNAYKVTDGVKDLKNYWAGEENGNVPSSETEIVVDLGSIQHLSNIHVYPYWGGNKRYYQYELYTSTDKKAWTKVAENKTQDFITDAGISHDVDVDAAYIKIKGVKTFVEDRPDINNFHLVELEAYGYEKDNIALGKKVLSSGTDTSAGSSSNSKESLINDGQRDTYWDGGTCASKPWVTIDLEDVYKLSSMNVITYWMRPDNRYYYYDIYTSTDGVNYELLYRKNNGTDPATVMGEDVPVDREVYARYVKLVGTYDSANPSFHLNELRIYGKKGDPALSTAKKELQDKIASYESFDTSSYTKSSVKDLQDALAKAEALLPEPTATLEQIKEAGSKIDAAKEALIVRAKDEDIQVLQESMSAKESLHADAWTDVSWQAVEEAYARAAKLLQSTDFAQTDVIEAREDLEQAMRSLVKKGAQSQGNANEDKRPVTGEGRSAMPWVLILAGTVLAGTVVKKVFVK